MATWRCPHCRTVQAVAPNCFVCGRSATSCATCVRFRRSVVSGLGFCALDRRREPLTGAEQRGCWTDSAERPSGGLFDAPAAAGTGSPGRAVGNGRGLTEIVRPPLSGR